MSRMNQFPTSSSENDPEDFDFFQEGDVSGEDPLQIREALKSMGKEGAADDGEKFVEETVREHPFMENIFKEQEVLGVLES